MQPPRCVPMWPEPCLCRAALSPHFLCPPSQRRCDPTECCSERTLSTKESPGQRRETSRVEAVSWKRAGGTDPAAVRAAGKLRR